MKNTFKHRWWATTAKLARMIVPLFLIILLLWFVDLGQLWLSLTQIGLLPFALVVSLEWAFYAVETFRIRVLSGNRYSLGAILRSRLLSVFAGNFLPGFASSELLRMLVLDKERPGNKIYLALLLLANRIYGLIGLAALLLIALIPKDSGLPVYMQDYRLQIATVCTAVLISPLVFHLRRVRRLMAGWVRRQSGRVRHFVRMFYLALVEFADTSHWAAALSTSALTNVMTVFAFWLIGNSIGLHASFFLWLVSIPLVTIATFLPIGYGAVGTQDAAMVMLSQFLGESPESLLAVSITIHLVRILGSVPGALYYPDAIALIHSLRSNKR